MDSSDFYIFFGWYIHTYIHDRNNVKVEVEVVNSAVIISILYIYFLSVYIDTDRSILYIDSMITIFSIFTGIVKTQYMNREWYLNYLRNVFASLLGNIHTNFENF